MIRLGIIASGSGSNAENFHEYFRNSTSIEVSKVYCNNPGAGILDRCHRLDLPCQTFTRQQLKDGRLLDQLLRDEIDLIVLAGFLWLIPSNLIAAFQNKIINIHPALLPKFGGKGMYGMNVHEAVVAQGESESGITIHLVNEKYDEGETLFQANVALQEGETPESLAAKIHQLEYKYFPEVVEDYALKLASSTD